MYTNRIITNNYIIETWGSLIRDSVLLNFFNSINILQRFFFKGLNIVIELFVKIGQCTSIALRINKLTKKCVV